ncbi:MAG: GAF domain-containing protein [Chloroflexi bacterium]|nr:GAF domain-containing protein [Chloroflexota bacterium]
MFDDQGDTARMKIQQPAGAQEQIRQIAQRVSDLLELLRNQRDILRQRGMNLPPGAMDSLRALRAHLDKLSSELGSMMIELGQLRALADTAGLINSSLDPADVLNQVMDTVIRLTGAERGYIVLKNRDTGALEIPVARGLDREQIGKSDFTVSTTVVNQVVNTGEPVLTDNASSDSRYQGYQSIAGMQLRSILAVPLKVRGEIIGAVYCDNRIMAGVFKQHELNLLTAFAHQAAVAIENARLFDDLKMRLAAVTEARDLMDNIFSSIASGVLTVNGDNVIMLCNAAAERILCCRRDRLIGYSLAEALPTLNGVFDEQLRRVRQDGVRTLLEVQPVLAETGPRHWNLIMSPLLETGTLGQGVVIVVDDLTEIRQREAQLGLASRYLPLALVENIHNIDVFDVGGQEREISVLHCDVRGFTSFSERLDPAVLMEIINSYMSLSSDAINLYEGIVDKYMGDAVTGLFNTQFNPQEDHALRAVRAAMSMMYDLLALHEVLPEEQRVFYGIGVHTGMAVLGNIGSHERKEFSALGDAMDIGKLLQENAQAGEVLISPATYEHVNAYYECEPLEPRKTKGRADFTLMYKVVKHKRRGTGTLDANAVRL